METPVPEPESRALFPGQIPEVPPGRGRALGSAVSADLEALRNDVEQARQLALDYQQQLAGKTNDHAALKEMFEKTRTDLLLLQEGVEKLREERHQFANEAMRAAALELRLKRITAERDGLRQELDTLLSTGARPAAAAPAPAAGRPDSKRNAEFISVPFFDAVPENDVTVIPDQSARSAGAIKKRGR